MRHLHFDELFGKQGKKLVDQVWACDCHTPIYQLNKGDVTFKETTVNSEKICTKCGHYAVRMEKSLLVNYLVDAK